MKKPVNDLAANYPMEESIESYYDGCESNNYSCSSNNNAGNGNGNSLWIF